MRVYRTSVKEDINVGNVFQHLAENYVHQWRLEQAKFHSNIIINFELAPWHNDVFVTFMGECHVYSYSP